MKRNQTFSFWGFIIAALILVFFSVQNAQEVGFRFFIWKTYLPLSVLLIVAFLLGLIVGAVFLFRSNRSTRKENKRKEQEKLQKDKDAFKEEKKDNSISSNNFNEIE
ncbi:LapA family protein [Marinilabilia rubra]|uniref:DUF1049 domain-containing protein n=1 Tax=Marinilabilia rubra TaxID=2162893 RepID=A0A2U2B4U4_9BACT|nr:LapA family protein [Marinilabilia rubra]PWD98076.1 DUF1049 domain-containing protein [Marinilabilia rubra]